MMQGTFCRESQGTRSCFTCACFIHSVVHMFVMFFIFVVFVIFVMFVIFVIFIKFVIFVIGVSLASS